MTNVEMTEEGRECIGAGRSESFLIDLVTGAALPRNDSVRVHFTFRVEKFRQLMGVTRPGQYLVSDMASSPHAAHLAWRLRLYPNGSCADTAGHLTIFLWQLGIIDPNLPLRTTFRIYALTEAGLPKSLCRGEGTFEAAQREWGKSGIPHRCLVMPGQPSLIHADGALVVGCEVTHRANLRLAMPVPIASVAEPSVAEESASRNAVKMVGKPGRKRVEPNPFVITQFERPTKKQVQEWKRMLENEFIAIHSRQNELYTQLFSRTRDGKSRLQLSTNLKPSILLAPDNSTGLVRSYYQTNVSKLTGLANSYRCTTCRDDFRVRVDPRTGDIVPTPQSSNGGHRLGCIGKTKAAIIIEQLKRRIKLWEKDGSQSDTDDGFEMPPHHFPVITPRTNPKAQDQQSAAVSTVGDGRSGGNDWVDNRIEVSTDQQVEEWRELLKGPVNAIESRQEELFSLLFARTAEGKHRLQLSMYQNPSVLLVADADGGLARAFCRERGKNCYRCTCSKGVRLYINAQGEIQESNPSTVHSPKCKGMTKLDLIRIHLRRRIKLWERQNGYAVVLPRAQPAGEGGRTGGGTKRKRRNGDQDDALTTATIYGPDRDGLDDDGSMTATIDPAEIGLY